MRSFPVEKINELNNTNVISWNGHMYKKTISDTKVLKEWKLTFCNKSNNNNNGNGKEYSQSLYVVLSCCYSSEI